MRPFILRPTSGIVRFILSRRSYSSASSSMSSSDDPMYLDRTLEPMPSDEIKRRFERFESPPDARIAKTVLLGCPNAGKSVLTNALIDAPISAVSSKVHTTRKTTRGACLLNDRTQLFVLDTPGVITSARASKHKLEETLLTDPEGAMLGADTVCVLSDASDTYTRDRLDPRILHLLYRHRHRLTSVLVLTKVDAVKGKNMLLDLSMTLTKGIVGGKPLPARKSDALLTRDIDSSGKEIFRNPPSPDDTVAVSDVDHTDSIVETSSVDETLRKYWTGVNWHTLEKTADLPWPQVQESTLQKCYRNEVGWPLFDRLFMVSALQGQGVDEIRTYLNERAKHGNWRLPPSVVTDQDEVEMVKNIVRAKLMDRLSYHIPYTLDFKVNVWEVNESDVLCIRMDVVCRQDRDVKFIIGPGGKYVAETAQDVAQVLRNLFQREVFFRLGVYASKKKKFRT